ncbi:hypothetical protein CPB83DRAFT_820484 [Crepidotus variabilis]|uniref:Uncharacterized protein n=1 Tax=Crepidotus variabilis TaxID=179855 RepID=A0A9P6E7M6_9AGAR|nr:hypothetical protein CPB83DRAFT_820484 [Crepidotus variabilis]
MVNTDTSEQLWYEKVVNASVAIGAIGYGLHIAVFYTAVSGIFKARDRAGALKWFPLLFILFSLGTINIAGSLRFNQVAFIDQRKYEGGPAAFFSAEQSNSGNVAAVATSIAMMVFADAFMIYRIHTLGKRIVITAVAAAVLVASVVMSGFHAVELINENSSSNLKYSIPYVSLATILNILITLVMAPRLLELRRQISISQDPTRAKFTNLEALVVETAFPTGLLSLIFIILYGFQKVGSLLFLPLLVQVMAIMPGLIISRMVRGYAWSNDVVGRLRNPSSSIGRTVNGDFPQDVVTLNDLGNDPKSVSNRLA